MTRQLSRRDTLIEAGRNDVTGYHEETHPPHRTPDGIGPWECEYLTGPGSTDERTFETEGVYDYVDTQEVRLSRGCRERRTNRRRLAGPRHTNRDRTTHR